MEKICIVKLRKNFANHMGELRLRQQSEQRDEKGMAPFASASETQFTREAPEGEGAADDNRDAAGRRISLTLTPDQMQTLRSNPHLASMLYEKANAISGKVGHRDEEMTIQLVLPSLPPVRLLKLDEVARMLRISRSCLHRIINEGKLKSYKLGKLRRVMLDDVLSYLESHQESPPIKQRTAKVKTSRNGMAQTYAIKEV